MKKKIRFYKSLLVEVLETLCSICLILERISDREHIDTGILMRSHFVGLKKYSEQLRQKGE